MDNRDREMMKSQSMKMAKWIRRKYLYLRFGRPENRNISETNRAFVEIIKANYAKDIALEIAVGGNFEVYGKIEVALLRYFGLQADHYLIDVGCGSGRLARPLSHFLAGRYLGTDLVPDLIAHAKKLAARPDWRFEVVDHISIPEADSSADFVCFFSVLTHLLHEQSYWYLEEAKRVLKPGGLIVFTFLEFRDAVHQPIFWDSLKGAKSRGVAPLNVFVDRDAISFWADALDMEITALHGGQEWLVPEGATGQAVCVLRKRSDIRE